MTSLVLRVRWLWAALWSRVEQWLARRRRRRLAQEVREKREKRYVLTVTRPRADCTCAAPAGLGEPCLICRSSIERGWPRHVMSFATLGEAEFGALRRTASWEELTRLEALGLLPKTRREVVRYPGQCRPEDCGQAESTHVHRADVVDFAQHEAEPCGDPECGGVHLRDLVWYEGALCRFTVLGGGGAEEDALRVALGEPSPVDPDTCPACYGELPHHEHVDCPGNDEQDERRI